MGSEHLARAVVTMSSLVLAASTPAHAAAEGRAAPTIAAFEAELAQHDSATEALRTWCEARGLASPAQIIARPVAGAAARPPRGLWQLLGIGARETIGYRHVELTCGSRVLSVAHNWYVPGRLTPEMNAALASTQVPFGRIAAPLAYHREPLEVLAKPPRDCPANTISAHRALLRLPDGRPLAYVLECYTADNIQ